MCPVKLHSSCGGPLSLSSSFFQFYQDTIDILYYFEVCNKMIWWCMYILQNDYYSKFSKTQHLTVTFFCVWWELLRPLSNFQIYDTMFLTTVTLLIHDIPRNYLTIESVFLLTTFIHFAHCWGVGDGRSLSSSYAAVLRGPGSKV